MKKFSVIIPCYEQAQYLADAIESVIVQTHPPHEIIVVNDGSKDETRYVALNYPEVTYIEQVNKGLSSARNTGLMNSTIGNEDYIYPLDADDIMMENCLEKVAKKIEETGADIIAPSFKCFGKHDSPIILMDNPQLEDFKTGNRIGYFSAIKKEALLEVGGWSPRMIWGYEDLHLWINLLTKGKKIAIIKEMLMLYRTKETSMITSAMEHHSELMTQIYKDFPSFK